MVREKMAMPLGGMLAIREVQMNENYKMTFADKLTLMLALITGILMCIGLEMGIL